MKLAQTEQYVRGSRGLTESKSFEVRINAHAFKMLSSGIYYDKIAAILREIGCNAADAHVEAGIANTPFEVKLPNRIDTQFYIRDFGPGLSHDDIMTLYTTYFASTKQSSNDVTGGFGLGSKSPFSYTDAFTIQSVYGGKKSTYSAHLGNDGAPTIALLTTEEATSDWPHGITVSFPVPAADMGEFDIKAKNVYQWFNVFPTILGGAQIQPPTIETDRGTFFRSSVCGNQHVLMGNVMYPIKTNEVIQGSDKL